MIYPSADKLEKWGSKYSLVVLAAKRAKQLKSGAAVMIETDSRNPLTVSLEEIAAGAIECRVPDNDLLPTVTEEPEVAALLAIRGEEAAEEAEQGAEITAEAAVEEEETSTASLLDEEEIVEEDEEDEEPGIALEDEEGVEDNVVGFDEDESDEDVTALEDDEEDSSGLVSDPDVENPLEEEVKIPKKPGRKRKAKVETEPAAVEETAEEPDEAGTE